MQQELISRIDQDLDKRSINGSYAYLACWLVIGFATGFYERESTIFWSISGGLLFFGVTRIALNLCADKLREKHRHLWLTWFLINTVGPSGIYSYLLCVGFYDPTFDTILIYLLMSVFAFVSGGVINFSPNPFVLFVFLFTLIFPPMLTAIFIAPEHLPEGALLCVYAIFMFAQSSRLIREYHQMTKQQVLLEEINNQDSLTGIGNRRYFDESMALAWKTQLRAERQVGLLIIDIDHFKTVNDTYGHAAGDEVIKAIAECLQQTCQRETDIVARFGGEEFAVLVAPGAKQEMEGLAEKIRFLVEATRVTYGQQKLKVTVSIGVALMQPSLDASPDDLFRLADQCLYAAKENGRNRVVSALA